MEMFRVSRLLLIAIPLFMWGCASGPAISVNQDPEADFTAYATYQYASDLGTDRGGYSTLITRYFKDAIDREMQARGYQPEESGADLIVNFNARVEDRTDVVSRPVPSYGYYGYRYGLYGAWPMYANDVSTVHYQVGTANVDIVDVDSRQLIWEGVAVGRLGNRIKEDPAGAISDTIAEIFTRYPVPVPEPEAE